MYLLDSATLELLVKRINDRSRQEGDCRISTYSDPEIKHKKKVYQVQRVLWQFHKGLEIPAKYTFQPSCGKKDCITLDHLHFASGANPTDKEEIKELMQTRSRQEGECRILDCNVNALGYGVWRYKDKQYGLQRVIIWLYSDWEDIEELPKDKHAAHLCRNLTCINQSHYELVTRSVNNYDHRLRDGTLPQGETCRFAKLTEENVKEIMTSWRPDDHPDYKSIEDRAEKFGTSKSNIYSIDRRISWKHLEHPNGLPPKKRPKVEKIEKDDAGFGFKLTEDDLKAISDKLEKCSDSEDVINKFTQTPCWIWKTPIKSEKPTMAFSNTTSYASIFACYVSSGPKPFLKAEARHLCGKAACVRPSHINWASTKENAADKRVHGTSGRKLTILDAREIRTSTATSKDVAAKFGISQSHVSTIRTNQRWKE